METRKRRDRIRFLLGAEPRELANVPPTLTILEYLRRHARLTGTKEGCAEGDCGACTLVLAEPDGAGGLRRWSVNSCIQFVCSLDGRQLVAVEHLNGREGALHPVQRALVEHHGSQCGFCTPGFVMALYAAWCDGGVTDRQGLKDWLSGNLCRCTGYGPILDAGMAALSARGAHDEDDAGTLVALEALDDGAMLAFEHEGRRWFAPRTADDLAALYAAHPDAVLVAGATDVGLWVTKQHRRLETLIDVTRIPELKVLEERDDALVIGAGVSHRATTPALARLHPSLSELMRRFASIPIRNCGTVGGNIANGSPIGDLAPAFIALGATLHLRRGSERRAMPLEDFFLAYSKQDRAPGEFVERIVVPVLPKNARFSCWKLSKRFDQDISAVMGAFRLDLDGEAIANARLAFGGMAATPKRALHAEAALKGRPLTRETMEAAALALESDFTPITDMRASARYRMLAAQNLLRRFGLELQAGAPLTRVLDLLPGATAHG